MCPMLSSPMFRGRGPAVFFKTERGRWIRKPNLASILAGILLSSFPAYAQKSRPDATQLQPVSSLKVVTDVVNVYAVVRDSSKHSVTNLKWDDFEVKEQGQQQQLRYFSRDTDTPLSLAVLVDTSPSQRQTLRIEQDNAKSFVDEVVRPNDLAMIAHFDWEVERVCRLTADHALLDRGIDGLVISGLGRGQNATRFPARGPDPAPRSRPDPGPTWNLGYTHVLDAVFLAANELKWGIGRKAILLIGDGVDTGSKVDLNTALDAAQRSDVVIYCLTVLDERLHSDFCRRRRQYYRGLALLRKLSDETGGRVISVRRARDTAKAFQDIAEDLRTEYFLGYTPLNQLHDGSFRKIKVRVRHGGYKVQARNGYYAPSQ